MEVSGRALVTGQDGSMLLEARDGMLWLIPPEEQIAHTSDDKPFRSYSRDDLSKRILSQLPRGFDCYSTKHYMIFHNTSNAYAQWCGSLFERLYSYFNNYWTHKGFDLSEPEFPLVAVIFADKREFAKASQAELGEATSSIIGFFSLMSNRTTMYDLTGIDAMGRPRGHNNKTAEINEILSQPDAEWDVSTIIHEATHQIAFNCGLHTRLSDCPKWFCEGIAMFFEAPDLRNSKGWSRIGDVNRPRLEQFQKYLAARPASSLETLIRDDKRFNDTKRALDAYAEAWALTYFLLHQHPKEYIAYLSMLSAKKPLVQDGPEKRLHEFQQSFGDLKTLDTEFLRYMANKVR